MSRDRGCKFMRRTRRAAGSEAEVEPQRAVRQRAWFHRKPDSSRVSEFGRWTVMLVKLSFSLSR